MTDQREAVIQVKGLKKNFGSLEVLKGVDMKVLKGEAVVVIGPSGSGKSTLLRCLNLLETPTGGDILFHGQSILRKDLKLDEYREKFGMVFQLFNLFENLSVLDNVTIGLRKVKKIPKEQAEKKAMELLKQVGLDDVFDAVSDGTNITKSKPDPEVFLKAAEYLGLPPKACMVVEDAEAGIEAAKKGGMYAAGIGEAAKSINADESLKTFSELVDIVDK